MRKVLVSILMLVMLTPSLACAMPLCDDAVKTVAIEKPCAGHGDHHTPGKEEAATKVALMKDCMGVDLQVVDDREHVRGQVGDPSEFH